MQSCDNTSVILERFGCPEKDIYDLDEGSAQFRAQFMLFLQPSVISWAEVQLGCWARHLPGQW